MVLYIIVGYKSSQNLYTRVYIYIYSVKRVSVEDLTEEREWLLIREGPGGYCLVGVGVPAPQSSASHTSRNPAL